MDQQLWVSKFPNFANLIPITNMSCSINPMTLMTWPWNFGSKPIINYFTVLTGKDWNNNHKIFVFSRKIISVTWSTFLGFWKFFWMFSPINSSNFIQIKWNFYHINLAWWWWIVFVVWLTDKRHLALFPAGTIARDRHHRKSLTCRKQDLNLHRTWLQALLNEIVQ